MNNVVNQSPYLRTSREYPEDIKQLTVEVNKTYLDVANAVNERAIGLYPTTKASITGNQWFLTGNKKLQSLRKVFSFSSTASIDHNIESIQLSRYVQAYGQYTDGTNWYGLLSASSTAIAGQVSFYITSTQIVFVLGAGAPSLTSGTLVLEWIANS